MSQDNKNNIDKYLSGKNKYDIITSMFAIHYLFENQETTQNLIDNVKNNLKVDYLFYLTNQIMNPSIQFLELIVEEPNKLFKDYCDKIKKNKELAFQEKKQNEYVSKMINNYGFKVNTNNEDWGINIDALIKQVQNNNPKTEKTKPRKKKK